MSDENQTPTVEEIRAAQARVGSWEERERDTYECPACNGEGEVYGVVFDATAAHAATLVGYGIGDGLRDAETLAGAVPVLLAEIDQVRDAVADAMGSMLDAMGAVQARHAEEMARAMAERDEARDLVRSGVALVEEYARALPEIERMREALEQARIRGDHYESEARTALRAEQILRESAERAERERDEARDHVGRLREALEGLFITQPGTSDERNVAVARAEVALASTSDPYCACGCRRRECEGSHAGCGAGT